MRVSCTCDPIVYHAFCKCCAQSRRPIGPFLAILAVALMRTPDIRTSWPSGPSEFHRCGKGTQEASAINNSAEDRSDSTLPSVSVPSFSSFASSMFTNHRAQKWPCSLVCRALSIVQSPTSPLEWVVARSGINMTPSFHFEPYAVRMCSNVGQSRSMPPLIWSESVVRTHMTRRVSAYRRHKWGAPIAQSSRGYPASSRGEFSEATVANPGSRLPTIPWVVGRSIEIPGHRGH